MNSPYEKLWLRSPALLYGLSAWIGSQAAASFVTSGIFYFGLLLCPLLVHCTSLSYAFLWRGALALAVATSFFFYVHASYVFPDVPSEGVIGTAHLHIDQLHSRTTHFGKQWIMHGTIRNFRSPALSFHRQLPVVVVLPGAILRPSANQDYSIEGKLKSTDNDKYIFKPEKTTPWYPIEGTRSFAEYRHHAKQALTTYINRRFDSPQSRIFLSGIATGTFDDRLMVHEFSRFGLQHIMAISGFHFAIIAGAFNMLLGCIFNRRIASYLLATLLTAYFIFLGVSPSIMRAWIMCMIGLFSFIAERPATGLNTLGVAMLATLAYDPLFCTNLGFQFTFAVTGALLILYSPVDILMQKLFKKRSLTQALQMSGIDKYGYIILSILRQGLSLTFAVNLIALPITLYYFHKFPLMSLLYNLFFPFFVSISILLLVTGGILALLFNPLGNAVHSLNDFYTHYLLQFTYNTPKALDYMIRIEIQEIPGLLVVCFIAGVFTAGIYAREKGTMSVC